MCHSSAGDYVIYKTMVFLNGLNIYLLLEVCRAILISKVQLLIVRFNDNRDDEHSLEPRRTFRRIIFIFTRVSS